MKKILNFRLSLFIALFLALGILEAYLFAFRMTVQAIILLAIFTFGLLWYILLHLKGGKLLIRSLCFTALFIMVFGVGFWGFNNTLQKYQNATLYDRVYSIQAKIIEVKDTENGKRYTLSQIELDLEKTVKYKAYLYGDSDCNFKVGDIINFSSRIYDKNYIYEGKLFANDIVKGVRYRILALANNITVVDYKPTVFERVNQFISSSLSKGLSGDEYSVAYALLTGNADGIDQEVITVFRNTGVAHIFAVSGLHIGFLATALNILFKKIRLNKIIKTILIALTLFFYSGVCGFSPSSIRASIMGTVMLTVSLFGERYDGLSSVSISTIIILIFSPLQMFTVGFLLSFVVVYGILVLSPTLKRTFRVLGAKLSSSLATVLSAQIFGLPICLFAFKKVSAISIIVNLIFIPVIGVIFIALILLTFIGGAFNISHLTLFPLKYVLKALIFLVNGFDKGVLVISGFTFGFLSLIYYLSFIILTDLVNLKRITKIIVLSILSISLVGGVVVKDYREQMPRVVISSSEDISFTLIASRKENVLVLTKFSYPLDVTSIDKVLQDEEVTQLNLVVVQNASNSYEIERADDLELFHIVSCLNKVAKVDKLAYADVFDQSLNSVINATYPHTVLQSIFNGELGYSGSLFKLELLCNGKAVKFGVNGKPYGMILANFEEYGIFPLELKIDCDLVIAYDAVESLKGVFNPKTLIAYQSTASFLNAQDYGRIKYYLR